MYRFILYLLLISSLFFSCKKDTTSPVEYDTYDYKSDILSMAQFYKQDPIRYYAEYGLPGLVVASNFMESLGENPKDIFNTLLLYFDNAKVQNTITNNQWQPIFINKFQSYPGTPQEKWVSTIRFFGTQLIELIHQNPASPQINVLHQYLGDGIKFALQDTFFVIMQWNEDINSYVFPAPINKDVCTCVMEDEPCDKDSLENDTIGIIRWKDVTSQTFPAHRYDGKCATYATGMCGVKLKIIPDSVDAVIWKATSRAIGALVGGGAMVATINAYYAAKGFGVTTASDKPGETAIEQAKKALDLGCDVKMTFNNPSNSKAHIEFVYDITVDADDTKKGTVTSHSSGQKSVQTFNGGQFSGKDTHENTPGDWLGETGKATFIIYCKK